MTCPKCNSINVQIQARNGKKPITIGCVLLLGGIGLMFLGIIGLAIGLVVGLVIGAIFKALMPTPVETIAVCQNCGHSVNPSDTNFTQVVSMPLENGHTELLVIRESNSCGSAIPLAIRLNSSEPFQLLNGEFIVLTAKAGNNVLHYEQHSGLGKKNRKGSINVVIDEGTRCKIKVMFTPRGIDIIEA